MDSFYALNKLLSRLPFSILGYYQHEKEIDSFFEQLCESDFIAKKSNIELVSYSYAKLKNLNDWKTESLSSKFFFHALNEKYSLLILNVYYSFRDNLFNKTENEIKNNPFHSNNVAIVLSRLFLKDVGFRLSYTTDTNWHFSLLEQNNVFSIKIPLSRILNKPNESPLSDVEYFKSALSDFLSTAIGASNTDNLNNLLVRKVSDSKSSYELGDDKKQSPISQYIESLRNAFKPKNEIEILRNEIVQAIHFWHITNPGYLTKENTLKHIENWVELFFQITFISAIYDAWIEYFPSVCGLDESKGTRQFRNLGGLILGYKTDASITQEERSIFRIISARISSTVAGQWLFEHNIKSQIDLNRVRFREFCEILNDTVIQEKKKFNREHEKYLHGNEENEEAYQITKTLLVDYKEAVGNEFEKWVDSQSNRFSKYLTVICSPDKQKSNAINGVWANGENHFFESCKDAKCLYCQLLLSLDKHSTLDYFVNMPLLNNLIIEFEKYPNTHRLSIKIKNGNCISFKYSHSLNLNDFLTKLKTTTTRSFTGIINESYYSILAMSDFSISHNQEKVFVLEDWLINKVLPKETTILSGFNLDFELKNKI